MPTILMNRAAFSRAMANAAMLRSDEQRRAMFARLRGRRPTGGSGLGGGGQNVTRSNNTNPQLFRNPQTKEPPAPGSKEWFHWVDAQRQSGPYSDPGLRDRIRQANALRAQANYQRLHPEQYQSEERGPWNSTGYWQNLGGGRQSWVVTGDLQTTQPAPNPMAPGAVGTPVIGGRADPHAGGNPNRDRTPPGTRRIGLSPDSQRKMLLEHLNQALARERNPSERSRLARLIRENGGGDIAIL